jgi:hypothetical protein
LRAEDFCRCTQSHHLIKPRFPIRRTFVSICALTAYCIIVFNVSIAKRPALHSVSR